MALVEHWDDLPMTTLEMVLKQCLAENQDMANRIPSSREMRDYILWMAKTYGPKHGQATHDMLPYFTPNNEMTHIAAEFVAFNGSHDMNKVARELAQHDEEGFIPTGRDISVGRMLRYFPSAWHTTTYFEVFVCFSGECPIHFQNEVIRLKRGDVLIVAPGVVRATPCFADDAVLGFYMIRTATFQRVFWNQMGEENLLSKFFRLALENSETTAYIHFETGDDADVRHLLLQIYAEYQQDQMYAPQMVNSLMRVFFLLLLRRYEGTARLPRTDHFFWKHQFSAILSYIQTNYQTATLNSVAERFNYSSKQVGRIVKDCTGLYFGDLIREMKMKKAAELLQDGRLPLEDVAAQVGFAPVNSFYRSFSDYYGVPPMEWMKENAASR